MQNIIKVLILAKQEFKQIHKNSYNPYHKFKYANLDAVLEAITPALDKYGLCLLQPTEIREDKVILKTVIYHVESGEQITGELLLPQNADPQKIGSAITYYRRYELCSLLGIVADEDDDGNATIPTLTKTPSDQSTGALPCDPTSYSKTKAKAAISYDDEEEKAKDIHKAMQRTELSAEEILKIAMTKFNSSNIRGLSWLQISQLKTYMQNEATKKKKEYAIN
jgi:hypothetical protein